jgi:Flp pilus assembly protein TadD
MLRFQPTNPRLLMVALAGCWLMPLFAQEDPFAPKWSRRQSITPSPGSPGIAVSTPTPALADPVFPVAVSALPSDSPFIQPDGISALEARSLEDHIPLEHQRYLLYLYAKIGRDDMAENLARRVLAQQPNDRDSLLAMTVMYVEKQRADQALTYASSLYRLYPTDHEAAYYYGMANYLAGNFAEATRILQVLKLGEYRRKPFPYNVDLGQSALRAGNWDQAVRAYRELLDNNHVNDELRREVRVVLDQLYRRHLSRVEALGNAYLLDAGEFQQYQVKGSHQLNRRTRIFAHLEHNQIEVEPTLNLRGRWNDANEVWAGAEYEVKPHALFSAWAGGANVGPQGGAKFRYRFEEKGEASIESFAHEKSRDGLLIQSLDGRQHRLTVAGSYYLRPRLLVFGELSGRQVVVDGTELGRGINGSWNAEFFVRRDLSTFRLGYRGLASSFGRRLESTGILNPAVHPTVAAAARVPILDELVLNRIHREGIYADWLGRVYGPVFVHLRGGLDYAFERKAMEYYTRIGLLIYPRRSLEIVSEVGYNSSVANANGGSGQWEINIALRYWF